MSKPASNPTTYASLSGNVAASTLDGSFSPLYTAINNINTYGTGNADTGVADAYIVTLPAGLTVALAAYLPLQFVAANTNTGPATLNGFGTGVRDVVRPNGAALQAGDITAGQLISVQYNGSKWQLLSITPGSVAPGVLTTGMVFDYIGTTAPAGYVLADGKTIGSAASAATERANADTVNLFTLLWNSMGNTEAPVSGGRGANAAADFAANKTITLPDARGRAIAGKDDMGGSTAGRLTNAASGITGTTNGTSGGLQTHTLVIGEVAAHTHVPNIATVAGTGGATVMTKTGFNTGNSPGDSMVLPSSSAGGGGAHRNVQPTLVLTKIIAL